MLNQPEKRIINIMINKAGGNAGSNSLNYRVTIPNKWAKELGITSDNREVEMTFDGKKITISKLEGGNEQWK